ncbi:MAG: hypothetical protein ABIH23_04055 [bacterium]
MTMLAALKKAISDLELQKNDLLANIEKSGWKDDRPTGRIPEETKPSWHTDPFPEEVRTPERSPLPSDAGRIYQQWYSAGLVIIEKNQPNRVSEFIGVYKTGIKQFLENKHITKDDQFRLMDLINAQFEILAAVPSHLEYSMYDVELTVYSVLMDDEIAAARYLLKNGFLRPAGALAGVILERHLKTLLRKHTPPIKCPEKAALSRVNDLCKETVYDVATWRKVQLLTDLRNHCDHDKNREPTKDELTELINGVSAILRTHLPNAS